MAEQRCADDGQLMDAAAAHRDERHHTTMDLTEEGGAEDLSLEEILRLYNQPINEEQAWAVCYQCCRSLAQGHRGRRSSASASTSTAAGSAGASAAAYPTRIGGPEDVRIQRDGSVRLQYQSYAGNTII